MIKVGVLIPAYNEDARLGAVLLKTKQYIPADHICVIDDGSEDDTAKIVKAADVQCIRFQENRGKGEALKAGFDWAFDNKLDAVITLDADGQHDPDLIPEFIQTMLINRYDVVLGTRRFCVGEMPLDRIFSNSISSFFVSLAAKQSIKDSQSGFRMFRLSVLKDLKLHGSLYELESEMLIRLGRNKASFGTCSIPATYTGAPSHIRRWRDVNRFVKMWFSLIFERKDSL
ncbi:glycosyltransferase family 2 protein [bacterium]